MTFKEIKKHCEDEGCSFDKIFTGVYLVKNCINGQICIVEEHEFYYTPTLFTYFYELGVSYPEKIIDHIHVYTNLRKDL